MAWEKQTAEQKQELAKWLATRPECVQKLASEFPFGSKFFVNGVWMNLLGWNESDCLLVTEIDPSEDYDGALAAKECLHADHVRKGEVQHARPQ